MKNIVDSLNNIDQEARKRVLSYVLERFKIDSIPTQNSALKENKEMSPIRKTAISDIRSLKDEKKPKTAIEMAVLVAYYLSEIAPEEERSSVIESKDITKYFKQAGFELPSGKPVYTLRNAKNSGYFDSAEGVGVYKINPVGYNLIRFRLPGSKKMKRPTKKKKTTVNKKRRQNKKKKSK
ncbi:hypothetical protein KAH94_04840 [bacterium]|nr:hypothetical protein [bacterium]